MPLAQSPVLCDRFNRASDLLFKRWTGPIIYLLLQEPCRFSEIREGIPDITDRVLSERLKELESAGIVTRFVIEERPVRVSYSLTKAGGGLADTMRALTAWARATYSQ